MKYLLITISIFVALGALLMVHSAQAEITPEKVERFKERHIPLNAREAVIIEKVLQNQTIDLSEYSLSEIRATYQKVLKNEARKRGVREIINMRNDATKGLRNFTDTQVRDRRFFGTDSI